jgi:hypothetical protein
MGTAGSGGTKEACVQCALRWEAVGLGLSAPMWFMRLFISYACIAAALRAAATQSAMSVGLRKEQ